jgi:hypothetical protein
MLGFKSFLGHGNPTGKPMLGHDCLFILYVWGAAHIQLLYFQEQRAYIGGVGTLDLEEPMTEMPINWARQVNPPDAKTPTTSVPASLRVVGALLRTIFILALLVVVVLVSMPQNETIWTAYETPADLVRMALGLGVCSWIGVQLFIMPKDPRALRTWAYLGLVGVPFALVCAAALWWNYLNV